MTLNKAAAGLGRALPSDGLLRAIVQHRYDVLIGLFIVMLDL